VIHDTNDGAGLQRPQPPGPGLVPTPPSSD
jgi:hypothetical protein